MSISSKIDSFSFWRRLGLASLPLSLAGTMAAQEGDRPVVDLPAQVVTAHRTPVEASRVAQSVDIVTADDIELTHATFGTDLLKSTSSVDVIQYPGGTSGVSVRGFRPQYGNETNPRVLLLIDGRPVSTSLGNLPTSNIERIEVLKGPASALYGASAMGGVINVITRKSTGELSGSAFVGYGSYETYEAGLRLGGGLTEQLDFDFSLDWIDRGDDYQFGDGDAYETGANGSGTYENTEFSRLNGSARLGYRFNDDWKLNVNYDFSDQDDTGMPGPLSEQKFDAADPSTRDFLRQGGSVDLTGQVEDHRLTGQLYFNDMDGLQVYSPDAASSYYRGRRTDTDIQEWGAQLQDFWSFTEQNDLLLGFDFMNQEEAHVARDSSGAVVSYYVPNYSRDKYGLYAESLNRYLDDTLILNLGGRYDWISTTVEASDYEQTSYQYAGGTDDFDQFSPRAGIVWKFTPGWRLHGSVGTAFIAPDAREVAGYYESEYSSYYRVSRGNENLDPETSVTWDAGLEYANTFLTLDATFFHTKVDDRIVNVDTGETEPAGSDGKERRLYTYVNAESQKMQGVELTSRFSIDSLVDAIPGTLDFTANLTWMDEATVYLEAGTEPVKNVAEWKGNLALDYGIRGFSTRFNARYNGNRWDKDYTYDDNYGGDWYEYPSYWVFDWSFAYRIDEHHKVSLYLNNLSDAYYYEKLDYPLEGRNASVRYTYSY